MAPMELHQRKGFTWILSIAGGIVTPIAIYLSVAGKDVVLTTRHLEILGLAAVMGAFLGGILAAVLRSLTVFKISGIDIELQPLREERKAIEQRIAARSGTALDIFSVIQLGLNQITEYYTINKSQARNSFRASMGAVIVGLSALSLGIVLIFLKPGKTTVTVATLSAVAGVLLQFIGGAYFYLYNKSLQQLNFFYETLVRLQDIMLAVQQVDQLGTTARDRSREAIIKALIRIPVNPPRIAEVSSKTNRGKAKAAKASA